MADARGPGRSSPARGKARKRALDVMFEADLRLRDPLTVLEETAARSQHPLNPYTMEIVTGVVSRRDRIDELLETYSVGWSIERMPAVDRNVLRIGVWELLWSDAPHGVVLAEATALATALSTEASGPFVNGMLARIVEVRPHLSLD